jgi:hypothetical protein
MFKKLLFLLPVVGLWAHVARADTIGGASCGSCLGSTYTLTYNTTANPDVFQIFLTIDASGYSNGAGDELNAVALKITSQTSHITSVNLVSPIPTGFGTTVFTGLDANGCAGGGGSNGFFCSVSTGLGLDVGSAGDVYTFQWTLKLVDPGDLFLGLNEASIKALYVDAEGQQHGITSEEITLQPGGPHPPPPIPEPSSLLLLGAGTLTLAALLRRKMFA